VCRRRFTGGLQSRSAVRAQLHTCCPFCSTVQTSCSKHARKCNHWTIETKRVIAMPHNSDGSKSLKTRHTIEVLRSPKIGNWAVQCTEFGNNGDLGESFLTLRKWEIEGTSKMKWFFELWAILRRQNDTELTVFPMFVQIFQRFLVRSLFYDKSWDMRFFWKFPIKIVWKPSWTGNCD